MQLYNPEDFEYCLKVAIGIIASPIPPKFVSKPISLANYDVGFVNNAVRSINKGEGLSDRQRALTIKLVSKYTRQYKRLGIDVTSIVNNPVWSSELRQVDRKKLIDIEEDIITIKFPYQKDMIREINSLAKKLRSVRTQFDKETKQYQTSYNEYNLLSIFNWSSKYDFEYSNKFMDVYKKCKHILHNRSDYAIQLVIEDDKCVLRNAPDTLKEYWVNNMASKKRMEQIVSAADQNLDIVNNSSNIILSNIGTKILKDRGGRFDWTEYTPEQIYDSAVGEFGFKRVGFIIDGRTMTEELAQNLVILVSKLGKDVCTVQLKNNQHHFNCKKSLTSDTKFAIIDSIQRYSNPKVKHDWKPDFVISTNSISKFRQYGFNILNGQTGVTFVNDAWVCYYTLGKINATSKITD